MQHVKSKYATKTGASPHVTSRGSEAGRVDLPSMVMQWRVSEIGESMHLNRTTIWRCIRRVRGRNPLLTKSARDRFSDLAGQIYDMTLQTIREAWRAYHSSQLADEPRAKSLYLARVQAGIAILTRFMQDLKEMDLEEKIANVEAQHKELIVCLKRVD